MTPHVCVICSGRGNVPAGFYSTHGVATGTAPEPCRSCAGTGVVWEPEEEPADEDADWLEAPMTPEEVGEAETAMSGPFAPFDDAPCVALIQRPTYIENHDYVAIGNPPPAGVYAIGDRVCRKCGHREAKPTITFSTTHGASDVACNQAFTDILRDAECAVTRTVTGAGRPWQDLAESRR